MARKLARSNFPIIPELFGKEKGAGATVFPDWIIFVSVCESEVASEPHVVRGKQIPRFLASIFRNYLALISPRLDGEGRVEVDESGENSEG